MDLFHSKSLNLYVPERSRGRVVSFEARALLGELPTAGVHRPDPGLSRRVRREQATKDIRKRNGGESSERKEERQMLLELRRIREASGRERRFMVKDLKTAFRFRFMDVDETLSDGYVDWCDAWEVVPGAQAPGTGHSFEWYSKHFGPFWYSEDFDVAWRRFQSTRTALKDVRRRRKLARATKRARQDPTHGAQSGERAGNRGTGVLSGNVKADIFRSSLVFIPSSVQRAFKRRTLSLGVLVFVRDVTTLMYLVWQLIPHGVTGSYRISSETMERARLWRRSHGVSVSKKLASIVAGQDSALVQGSDRKVTGVVGSSPGAEVSQRDLTIGQYIIDFQTARKMYIDLKLIEEGFLVYLVDEKPATAGQLLYDTIRAGSRSGLSVQYAKAGCLLPFDDSTIYTVFEGDPKWADLFQAANEDSLSLDGET
jgi:hypothetical protein